MGEPRTLADAPDVPYLPGMRTPFVFLVAVSLLSFGCADEGGGESKPKPRSADPNATVSAGDYVVSDAGELSDDCDLSGWGPGDGVTEAVTVTGNTVSLPFWPDLTLSDGNLSGGYEEQNGNAWNLDEGVDCTADISFEVEGTVPEDDQLDILYTVRLYDVFGADCGDLDLPVTPCRMVYFFRLTLE